MEMKNSPTAVTKSKLSLAHRAASGAMWITLEMGCVQGISLLVFAVMAHFVEPKDFGLISISYLSIFTFKSLIIDSVVFPVIRKEQAADIDYTTAFWMTFAFALIASLAVFLSAGEAERLLHAPGLSKVMRAMSVILLFIGLARTHEMRLTRFFQFRILAFRAILGAVIGGVIGIVLAVFGYGVTALVVQQIATSGISLALLWTASSWRPDLRISMPVATEILLFMRSMMPTSMISVVNQNCDTWMVAYFFGPASTGLYSVAKRLRVALQTVVGTPINSVGFSALAEVQSDAQRLKQVSRKIITLISFLCAPIFFGSSAISWEIIQVAFGAKWAEAAPVFALLSISGLFIVFQSFSDAVFTLKKCQIWSFYMLLLYTFIAILLFFLSSALTLDNLALPFILPYGIVFPLSAALVSRLIGLSISEWIASIAPPIISSGLMFVSVKLISQIMPANQELLRLAVLSIAGVVIYGIAMLLVGRTTLNSMSDYLRDVIARRRSAAISSP